MGPLPIPSPEVRPGIFLSGCIAMACVLWRPDTNTDSVNEGGFVMARGETGFDDVTFDLVSVQYHSLKAGHDYGQYVRDARNAGKDDSRQRGVIRAGDGRRFRAGQEVPRVPQGTRWWDRSDQPPGRARLVR